MKRFALILFTLALAFSMVTASAEVPGFMTKAYNNYTADYGFTVTFESSDEIIALLEEIEMPGEVNNFIDIKALLESILSQGMQMKMQINTSDDYRKAELALTADAQPEINVNSNLSIGVKSKAGMWMKMDLDAVEPVLQVVYSLPLLNKYMVIDVFEMLPNDAEKEAVLNVLNSVFNRDFIDSVNEYSVELLEKYAEIKVSGTVCTVKLDNNGLVAMMGEMVPVISTKLADIITNASVGMQETMSVGVIGGADGPTAIMIEPEAESDSDFAFIPDISEMQILGKEGITYKYSLVSGKISAIDMSADISFDISKYVTDIIGEDWELNSKGILDFAVKAGIKLTNVGKTKVEFPVLTPENSFNIMDMIPEYDEAHPDEYVPSYPYYSVWIESAELPIIDGEIYVPLRATLEGAYADQVSVGYDNGIITMESEYFPGFKKMTVYENSTVAHTDGVEKTVSKVIVKDGVTYVGKSLFEEIFDWELGYASYDLINNYYEATFYTGSF